MTNQPLDTAAAADYLGWPLQTFKWWVWQAEESRRCEPAGYVGRSPYWTAAGLDEWKQTQYRGPGRPTESHPPA